LYTGAFFAVPGTDPTPGVKMLVSLERDPFDSIGTNDRVLVFIYMFMPVEAFWLNEDYPGTKLGADGVNAGALVFGLNSGAEVIGFYGSLVLVVH
jgi:hypothetical protein